MDWGAFSFSKAENAPQTSPENKTPNVASDSGPAANQARESAKVELETAKRKRGRPPNTSKTGGTNSSPLQPELNAELVRQLEALYDPKSWGALLGLPGDVALAFTGNDKRWNISGEERATLGATGSAAARTLMITNPRTLALMMVSSALFSVYVPRAMQELKEIQQRKADKQKGEKKAAE